MTKHVYVDEAFAAELLRMRGYIVLTADEAKFITAVVNYGLPVDQERALALLTPSEVSDE